MKVETNTKNKKEEQLFYLENNSKLCSKTDILNEIKESYYELPLTNMLHFKNLSLIDLSLNFTIEVFGYKKDPFKGTKNTFAENFKVNSSVSSKIGNNELDDKEFFELIKETFELSLDGKSPFSEIIKIEKISYQFNWKK